MYAFSVNGKPVQFEGEDKKLLRFLRENLNLTGTKDGCSEGACGTCTVLVDGVKMKACAILLSRLAGKSVTTVEGLSKREQEVYSYCFAEAGAVQCGYCTPGMIISAKSLLDKNPDPSLEDVKKAIKGNICRCTGYKKIEEAINGCRLFRENLSPPINKRNQTRHALSASRCKVKALVSLYTDDSALRAFARKGGTLGIRACAVHRRRAETSRLSAF